MSVSFTCFNGMVLQQNTALYSTAVNYEGSETQITL